MSNDNIPIYKFKPFQFTVLKKNNDPLKRPLARSGHRVVCNNSYLFSYGGFNPQTNVGQIFIFPIPSYSKLNTCIVLKKKRLFN